MKQPKVSYEDVLLQPSTSTPVHDTLRWPLAVGVATSAVILRILGVRAAIVLLAYGILVETIMIRGFIWKWHVRRSVRRIVSTSALCANWAAMTILWPWWFSAPGKLGHRVLLWPTTPALLLVYAAAMIGWRRTRSERSIKKLEGREKLALLDEAIEAPINSQVELEDDFLAALIAAGVLPMNTRALNENARLTLDGASVMAKTWTFSLPRGHRGLDTDEAEKGFASFLTCGLDDVRVSHAKGNRSVVVFEQLLNVWQDTKPGTWRAGLLRMGFREDSSLLDLDVGNESAFHLMVSGMTGSGKSNTIKLWISEWILQRRAAAVELWLGDPTGGSELGPFFPWARRKALSAEGCAGLLADAVAELEDRYASMGMVLDHEAADYDEDAFSRVYDGPYLVIVIDEFPAVIDEDRAVLAHIRTLVFRGRRARIALCVGQQTPRAKTMGGDSKSQFPTRICHQVTETAESNLGLKNGLAGSQGIDASKLTKVGRCYMVIPTMAEVPQVQVFHAPAPSELALVIPRSPDPGPVGPGGGPKAGPVPGPDPLVPGDRPWSEPVNDVRVDGQGPGDRSWVPDGWDLPEFEPERADDGDIEVDIEDTHTDALDDLGPNARAVWDALAAGRLSGSAVFKAAGLSKGKGAWDLLAKMVKAGLIEQDSDARWFRIEDPAGE